MNETGPRANLPTVTHVLDLAAPLLPTLAQAGGGGSFGSGGGGGSGGGDGGALFELLFWLVFAVPEIGVPAALVVIAVVVFGGKAGARANQGRVIRQGRPRRERARAASTTDLTATDPDFDPTAFLDRVRRAFHVAQDAWCAQDLAPLRPFVSDGVFERFSLQVADQVAAGWRQRMDDTSLGAPVVVACDAGPVFDRLTVRLPFQARISKVDRETDEPVPGSTLPERTFAECWTFLRRRGTRTLSADGLMEGQCPNCGAPLELARSARCGTCEAEVLSGYFDWVLTEITQASVWRNTGKEPPGLAAYREVDPHVDPALLEDQVSVAFWRLRLAERAGDVGPVLAAGTEAWCEDLRAGFAARGDHHLVKLDPAVGAVDTVGVLLGDDRDRVLVEVVWDGVNGAPHEPLSALDGRSRTLARHLVVLGRKAGRTTRWKDGLTTAHCTTCGGHDTGDLSELCPWCEAPRRGGPDRWLVEEVVPRAGTRGRELLERLATATHTAEGAVPGPPPVPRQLLVWAASLAGSDGELSPDEREVLVAIGRRAGLSENELAALTPRQLGLDTWEAEEPPAGPVDQGEARAWLTELIGLALADGNLDARERRWLERATHRVGLVRADLNVAINKERARLYRETKAAPRQGRA